MDLFERENKNMKRNTKILNILTLICILGYSSLDLAIAMSPCFDWNIDREMGSVLT